VLPRAGSGVERRDPHRFLAGCRERQPNQALSVWQPKVYVRWSFVSRRQPTVSTVLVVAWHWRSSSLLRRPSVDKHKTVLRNQIISVTARSNVNSHRTPTSSPHHLPALSLSLSLLSYTIRRAAPPAVANHSFFGASKPRLPTRDGQMRDARPHVGLPMCVTRTHQFFFLFWDVDRTNFDLPREQQFASCNKHSLLLTYVHINTKHSVSMLFR